MVKHLGKVRSAYHASVSEFGKGDVLNLPQFVESVDYIVRVSLHCFGVFELLLESS